MSDAPKPTGRPTCDELWAICEPHGKDVAVLVAVGPGRQIQFVTYGRRAEDKVEAHQIKEWIVREAFFGERPPGVVHESFILDAAVNKERLDAAVAALEYVQKMLAQPVPIPGGGGEETLAQRLAAMGGVRAESLVNDALAGAKNGS